MVHQSGILGLLLQREGLNYLTENGTVDEALNRVYNKAAVKEDWSTVRYCASILHKVIDSMAPSITSMLVAGKIVSYISAETKTMSEVAATAAARFPHHVLKYGMSFVTPLATVVAVSVAAHSCTA